ncbi:MAG: FAD-dependent oxidoreductase [Eggerthellaceae bacterium]|nr:FAD-dependent oxidoreductase [Eggerthellaceae bacterium]
MEILVDSVLQQNQEQAKITVEAICKALASRVTSGVDSCPVYFAAGICEMCAAQSCGKCTPCRIGLSKLAEELRYVVSGQASGEDLDNIKRMANVIADSADCAIGFQAGKMVSEIIKCYLEDAIFHIEHAGSCGIGQVHCAPCAHTCPAGVDVPGYIKLVEEGCKLDAVKLVRHKNPFCYTCGMICDHPCEAVCRRKVVDDAINIRGIKKFACTVKHTDYVPKKAKSTGKNIAIIGGGPAGLTAAYYLALMGHSPLVFEAHAQLGGMLRYGIPAYRLPRKGLDEEIKFILDQGVNVKCKMTIDSDALAKIIDEYDATYLAIGDHCSAKLEIDGEDAPEVLSAVQILCTLGDAVDAPDNIVAAQSLEDLKKQFGGKKIIVIGGGNVAMDCARSVRHLGADATVVYRRRLADMPAHEFEILGAMQESINFEELMAPVEILTKNEHVSALRCRPQIVADYKNRRANIRPAVEPAVDFEADYIIVAIGQKIESESFEALGIKNVRGCIATNENFQIFCEKGQLLFAGGDCVTGPKNVITSVATARKAAFAIDSALGFKHQIAPEATPSEKFVSTQMSIGSCARINQKEAPSSTRVENFDQVEKPFTEEEACQEARRCLHCNHFGIGSVLERWYR